jgi:hypothetical protein
MVLDLVKKRYWWIILASLVIGMIIDYFNLNAVPIISQRTLTDIEGNSKTYEIFVFSYPYELLKTFSSICYGFAISLFVLLGLEVKYDDKVREEEKKLEEVEREKFKGEIAELQQKINENVFDGVLKKIIPEDLFKIIAKDVLNKSIVRQNAHWDYELSEGDNSNYIVTQTIMYELKNISQTTVSEPLTVRISDDNFCKSHIEFFQIDQRETITKKTRHEIELESEMKDGIKSRTYPVVLKPDEIVRITMNVVNVYRDKVVCDSHTSNYSIVGLTIHVTKPENCSFTITPTFSSKLIPTIPSSKKIIYDKIPGLLIGQGLTYTAEEYPPLVRD